MKSYEYVAEIALKENKDKIVQVPQSIEEIEDWRDLVLGLKAMTKYSYKFIEQCKEINTEDELPIMSDLNVAGQNIQFATAQLLATYTAFYDLKNKMLEHNEKIIKEEKA